MKHLAVEPQVSVLSRSGTHDGPAEALTVSSEGGTTVRATLPAVNDLEGCNYRKLCHRSGAASRRGSQYAQPELRSPALMPAMVRTRGRAARSSPARYRRSSSTCTALMGFT
jgi:hypothetical protein